MRAKSTVSFARSTAGGCEVSEAAVRMMVIPIPTSASSRCRNREVISEVLFLRSSKKLMPPSSSDWKTSVPARNSTERYPKRLTSLSSMDV